MLLGCSEIEVDSTSVVVTDTVSLTVLLELSDVDSAELLVLS